MFPCSKVARKPISRVEPAFSQCRRSRSGSTIPPTCQLTFASPFIFKGFTCLSRKHAALAAVFVAALGLLATVSENQYRQQDPGRRRLTTNTVELGAFLGCLEAGASEQATLGNAVFRPEGLGLGPGDGSPNAVAPLGFGRLVGSVTQDGVASSQGSREGEDGDLETHFYVLVGWMVGLCGVQRRENGFEFPRGVVVISGVGVADSLRAQGTAW